MVLVEDLKVSQGGSRKSAEKEKVASTFSRDCNEFIVILLPLGAEPNHTLDILLALRQISRLHLAYGLPMPVDFQLMPWHVFFFDHSR